MVAECEDVRGHRSGGRTFHGVTGSNAPLGSPARHNTVHHINTTPGPPISSQPRRLAPDRLKIVKDEYDAMLQDGTATSSDSPWSSALHLTQRKIAVGASVLNTGLSPWPSSSTENHSGYQANCWQRHQTPGTNYVLPQHCLHHNVKKDTNTFIYRHSNSLMMIHLDPNM